MQIPLPPGIRKDLSAYAVSFQFILCLPQFGTDHILSFLYLFSTFTDAIISISVLNNDFSIKKTYGVSPQNVHDDKPSDTAPPLKNRLSA